MHVFQPWTSRWQLRARACPENETQTDGRACVQCHHSCDLARCRELPPAGHVPLDLVCARGWCHMRWCSTKTSAREPTSCTCTVSPSTSCSQRRPGREGDHGIAWEIIGEHLLGEHVDELQARHLPREGIRRYRMGPEAIRRNQRNQKRVDELQARHLLHARLDGKETDGDGLRRVRLEGAEVARAHAVDDDGGGGGRQHHRRRELQLHLARGGVGH